MLRRVLVTGSAGLVGTALSAALAARGVAVTPFDRRDDPSQDVRSRDALKAAATGCTGIVHLAATSRVTWAEDAPEEAWANNVGGTENVLAVADASPTQPWVLYASSREVYGPLPEGQTVHEDAPLAPMNTYARTKVEGERLMTASAASGARRGIVRFSNIYGAAADHHDRVVPAFLLAALNGRQLTVEGADNAFDFVYLSDAVDGALGILDRLEDGQPTPPIQLVTGTSTSLQQLADLALKTARAINGCTGGSLCAGTPRRYDVRSFQGSAARAQSLLGWRASVRLEDGLARLAHDLIAAHAAPTRYVPAP